MTRLNQLTKPWKEKEKGHNLNDKRPKDRMNEKWIGNKTILFI